jgi:DNA-binding NarL/FixJ family response regulator
LGDSSQVAAFALEVGLTIETNDLATTRTAPTARISSLGRHAELVLALIDQSQLRRECLKLAMAQHNARWRVVDFPGAAEVIAASERGENFDLVLMAAATSEHVDLREIEALRKSLPETPVVVTAETDHPQRTRAILACGTRGFLPASLSLKVMMGALDLVLAGGIYVPSSLIDALPTRPAPAPGASSFADASNELTRRQRDVLGLISQGKSNKLIADALTMSESTVKAHVKQIIKRLRVANRTQAALLATGVFARNAASEMQGHPARIALR